MDGLKKETHNYDVCLKWIPNFKCNLNCVYCWVKDLRNTVKISEINIPDLIETLNKTEKIINVEIGGGEPFLIPNLIEASIEITKNHFISLQTNLTSGKIKKFSEEVSPERTGYIFSSLHIKELERLNLLDKYIENFHICKDRGFNIGAFVVAYPPILDEINEYKKFFQEKGIILRFKPFIGEFDGRTYPNSYTEKEFKIFNFNKKLLSENHNKGKLCNAGYNVCAVYPYGEVRLCFVIHKMIGNINTKIKFTDGLIQCPFKFCPCPIYKKDINLFIKAVKEIRKIRNVYH